MIGEPSSESRLELCRKRLFGMINNLPTVFDVVTGKKPEKEKATPPNNSSGGNKSKSAGKLVSRARFLLA